VGAWAEEKHRLISLYSTLFSSGMKAKWSRRIYVELYAGAGCSKIRGTSKFDLYVFCEEKANNLSALRIRSSQIAPDADIAYVQGDCNKRTSEILAKIPKGSAGDTALSLCFADPFDISLEFETIRALANGRYVDFLILLALGMDANRNYGRS
jgi:three-Cys-motif partner protein